MLKNLKLKMRKKKKLDSVFKGSNGHLVKVWEFRRCWLPYMFPELNSEIADLSASNYNRLDRLASNCNPLLAALTNEKLIKCVKIHMNHVACINSLMQSKLACWLSGLIN